ncbi:carbohydrate binding domain-containing protein [Alteribacter natronophilus]|uniref:carbohydrate binding domain-containing protein n=1 Tax=Alteribacter natronophilus TaxID=2583810 RepID=UPI00110DBC84|nr:carbohydrate binding domain-containing protein [Alteribacter natronophilus]TMW70092.1 glycosyl hydrolase family protein [Alteribacter natronophilus]
MLRKSIGLVMALILAMPVLLNDRAESSGQSGETEEGDWTLTWEDQFEGNELDPDKWTIDTGNGFYDANGNWVPGWGNEELQSYQEDNVRVEDGKLVLEGREETVSDDTGTYDYTSGKVHSQGKFSQKYGKFEARMKLPEGQGYWPAFWMMPEDDVYGGWAASGEIDIMEAAGGRPDHIGGAIHYGAEWPGNTYTAKDYYFPEGTDITDFNVYSIEWEPGEIRWYVNGELYQTLNNWSTTGSGNPAKFSYPAPFDQEFYLILNLAVGGWYGGDPDETTPFPGDVVVDYVKAYELTGRDYMEPVEPVFEAEELPEGAKEAIDGNYVYDPAFEEGFTNIKTNDDLQNDWTNDYWNLVHLNEFNGDAAAAVEDVNGDPFAKVDISAAGSQTYAVQLIQNVTLGKGRWYKLSFDAKAAADRTMNVKLGGGPERGYTAYSPSRDFALTENLETYEMIFQMQHDSDALARLEYNLGLNTNSVWVGNVVLEEVEAQDPYNETAPKRPLANGNHVYNGTFDQGRMDRMTFWDFDAEAADAEASVDPIARDLEVVITDGGEIQEAVSLRQYGMNLLGGAEYELSFNGSAAEERDISIALLSENGEAIYHEETVSLKSEQEDQTFTFTMPDVTDPAGQLVFYFGGSESNVVLDDVEMYRISETDIPLSDAFPLKNGSFVNGAAYWHTHVQGDYGDSSSAGSFKAENGKGVFSVQDTGANPWDLMLFQENLPVKAGNTYVVQFDAKSSVDRTIEAVVENASYYRHLSEEMALTEEMETFTFEFTVPEDDTVGLKYLLGAVEAAPHDVTVSNVRFEVKGEREKYFPLKNGDFSHGPEEWGTHLQGDWDGESQAVFSGENEEARISIEHTGANPWDIQLTQPELSLNEGQTYVVEFDASSTADRSIEVVLDNGPAGGYYRHFEEIVQLTDEAKTFTFEFEMGADDTVGFLFLLGNVLDEQISASHDVVIDNVRVEVQGVRDFLDGEPKEEEDDKPLPSAGELLKVLEDKMNDYIASGDIRRPLTNKLTNTLRQAQHHESSGRIEQAEKFVHKYVDQLDSDAGHIEEDAKGLLEEAAENVFQALNKETE